MQEDCNSSSPEEICEICHRNRDKRSLKTSEGIERARYIFQNESHNEQQLQQQTCPSCSSRRSSPGIVTKQRCSRHQSRTRAQRRLTQTATNIRHARRGSSPVCQWRSQALRLGTSQAVRLGLCLPSLLISTRAM